MMTLVMWKERALFRARMCRVYKELLTVSHETKFCGVGITIFGFAIDVLFWGGLRSISIYGSWSIGNA